MKSHKYWSLGALFCMLGCIYSGIKKSMTAHKYFAYSSLLCMGMSIYSGHKLISPKKKKFTESNNSENSYTKIDLYSSKTKLLESIFSPATFSIFKPLKLQTQLHFLYLFHLDALWQYHLPV